MTTKSTTEVFNDIIGVTKPMERMFETMQNNEKGTPAGRKQAGENRSILEGCNQHVEKLAAQAALSHQQTHTQSIGMSRGRSGSSSTNSDDRDK